MNKLLRNKFLSRDAKFENILSEEQKVIGKDKNLIGLAFSGGGIRSATVNLGVLQSLAQKNLLDKFDYLSTVSGGGYIGAFLSSLIKRSQGDMDFVKAKLSNNDESSEVNFLRKYSHYLTPKIGFSTDTMAALSIWLTNTLLNQLVLILAIATCCASGFFLNELAIKFHSNVNTTTAILGLVVAFIAFFMAIRESMRNFSSDESIAKTKGDSSTRWRTILIIGLTGVIFISLWLTATGIFKGLAVQPNSAVTLSPFWLINPVFVGLICLGIILTIGITGRGFCIELFNFRFFVTPYVREWWARLGGVTLSLCIAWLAGYLLVLYLPLLFDTWLSSNTYSTISAWGVIASISAYLGKTSSTSGLGAFNIKEKITTILPWLVIGALISLVSFGVFKLSSLLANSHWSIMQIHLILAFAFAILTTILAWRVDVNIFSLHYFYRNRLTRAYLGATNTKRSASLFTGFDPNDDMYFADCQHRPLHIVNTAINLTNTKDLAWQQRMAASFTFTPLYTGFEFPCKTGIYQPTAEYEGENGVALGSIMSLSGAAASPNSGYHTSPATAFIMTMFNARLGRWCGNPLKTKWRNTSPAFGLGYLAKELFAKANIDSSYVYLSDGGHFENLGIYELVRRQCKLVVAVDCGQDGDFTFEDLGNAIRKCQTDFGVCITIDVSALHPTVQSQYGNFKHAKKHFSVGRIHYKNGEQGILLYIKNSLTGDEPTDLINYKLEEPSFPHHSTIDQFFSESQFESYRQLGYHMGNNVFSQFDGEHLNTVQELVDFFEHQIDQK
jgi:hypothetical protein